MKIDLQSDHKSPEKNPWFVVYIILSIICIVALVFGIIYSLINLQKLLFPEGAFHAGYTNPAAFAMFLVGVFPAVILGLLLSTGILSLFPGFKKYQKLQKKMSSKMKNKILLLMLLCVLIMLKGFFSYFSLDEAHIFIRPLFSLQSNEYTWDQIKGVRTRCYLDQDKGVNLSYILILDDGFEIDLFKNSVGDFPNIYPRVRALLPSNVYVQPELDSDAMRKLYHIYSWDKATLIKDILYNKSLVKTESIMLPIIIP